MKQSAEDLMVPFLLSPRWRLFRHLLLQVVLLLITLTNFWDEPTHFICTIQRFSGWIILFLVLNLALYINIYVLAPRYLLRRKMRQYEWAGIFLIIGMAVSIVALQSLLPLHPDMVVSSVLFTVVAPFSSVISCGVMVAGTSTVLLFKQWLQDQQQTDELETITLHSELAYLKQQINPHFLFNMLNNANVLLKQNPDEASRVLFKLEDLLRYQMNDSVSESVLLDSEIRFLNDFLNLEKIRRDKFEYTLTREGDTENVYIAPLLFIPFVENAVKHNPDLENPTYVHLVFKVAEGKLFFRCENSKSQSLIQKPAAGGLGLENIKRRLELLYPDQHTLEINENTKHYTVTLWLNLPVSL